MGWTADHADRAGLPNALGAAMTNDDASRRPTDVVPILPSLSVVSATVANPTGTGDRFVVELTADRDGPPWPIRMRRWLKEAGRSHGLTCTGVAAVAHRPTAHRPATNAPGHWRPSGRGIRRAAGGPQKGVRPSDGSKAVRTRRTRETPAGRAGRPGRNRPGPVARGDAIAGEQDRTIRAADRPNSGRPVEQVQTMDSLRIRLSTPAEQAFQAGPAEPADGRDVVATLTPESAGM